MTKTLLILLCCIMKLSQAQKFLSSSFLDIEMISPCEDNSKLESPLRNFKFTRVNRTHRLTSADFTLKRDLGDNTFIRYRIERHVNNRWTEGPGIPQQNVCKSYVVLFKDAWISFTKSLNLEKPEICPLPAGSYHINSYSTSYSQSFVPLFEGRYRVKQEFFSNDGIKIYCICIVINAKPLKEH